MKNSLWIFLVFGFFLFAQGWPQPVDNNQDSDDYPGDDGDKDNNAEDSGPAPILHSKNMSFTFDLGDTARLPCKIENDNSVVLWWLDKSILWTDKIAQGALLHPNFHLEDDHSLTINGLKAEDSGVYNCSIVHDHAPQFVIYDVHVAAKPEIIRTVPSEEKKIIEKGSPLTLMCEAVGYPAPKLSWTKKTRHGEDKIEGPRITIDSVTRKHSGSYECKATNNKGEDVKKIEVHVQYEPEVEVDSDVVYSGEGYESELSCIVHGEPKAKVSWLKDGKPLVYSHNHITLDDKGSKHFLRISGTTRTDFGEYRCIGQNTKGTNSKTITLTGKPTQPKFSAAEHAVDGKSPVLSWSTDSYSKLIEFELLYRPQDKGEWKSQELPVEGSTTPRNTTYVVKHTFEGLEPIVYQAQLRARNINGWSELSDAHTFTGHVVDSDEVSQSNLLEVSADQRSGDGGGASELRISFALVISLLVARYYC